MGQVIPHGASQSDYYTKTTDQKFVCMLLETKYATSWDPD